MEQIHSKSGKINSSCAFHLFAVISLVLLCLLTQQRYVYAGVQGESYNASGLSVEVSAGYQGIVRLGRDTSVYIMAESSRFDFEGTVRISFPDAAGDTASYTKQITLEQFTRKCIVFTIPVTNIWSQMQVEINDYTNGNVFNKIYKMKIQKDMDCPYIGVLSDQPVLLTYLKSDQSEEYAIDPEKMHYAMTDWNLFDVIVIDGYDLQKLDAEQFKNLLDWLAQGGTMVVGTGERYHDTMDRLNDSGVLHSKYNAMSQCPTLLGMTRTDIKELKNSPGMEDLAENKLYLNVSDFKIDGSHVLRRDMIPLVEQITYEQGNILVYHIELGVMEFQKHIISADIARMVIGQFGVQRQELLNYHMYDSNVNGYAMNVVKESNEIEVPSILGYLILLILYLLISGPVLHIILTKLGRQKSIWWLLPSTTVLFLLLILAGGRKSILKDVKSSYFNIQSYDGYGKIQEYSVFNLTVPYYDRFAVTFDTDTSIKAVNDGEYGYFLDTIQNSKPAAIQDTKRVISEESSRNCVYIQDLTPFSTKYFTAQKTYPAEGSYQSNFHFSPEGFQGSFENNLGYNLDSAFLISSGSVVSLGEIPDGAEASVEEGEGTQLLSSDYTMISNYVEGALADCGVNQDLSFEMSGAVNYFIQEYFREGREKSFVIAFTTELMKNSILNELTNQTKSLGVNLAVYPVEIDYKQDGREFVPNMDHDFKTIEGNYTIGDLYRIFNGTLIVEYHLPENEKVDSFVFSDYLNFEYDVNTYTGFTGSIYFYNRKTKKYDLVFGPHQPELTEISDYLSGSNSIIVKYREKNNLIDSYMTIPYISYYKEAD